ncbi:triphosphoribosyl-dephospho-CoA synthase [Variovorax sp. J22R24]|uniref:triphosphoribosyl-dephospho-CoA synthase n=1 Tax=Variovorax gracilis TaxID=3053502 RepID=UPI0025755FA2|nr:triphosphoribosyl-dephospho-CoA synthase [Variovorax sp. J22R24]MDM0103512.1 triphosphoribosyl-dephospho-CoA synthase [Variovorax sp. J22R24]
MPVTEMRQCATERAKACFLRACELDVAVRKPGNVSRASAGHAMTADDFIASAGAVAGPLFERGASVGERIEASVDAAWAVANCNTNLGIVLLCAPIARAVELRPDASAPEALQGAIEIVLGELDLADAQAAFRAIARARPGGLGAAPAQDVRHAPSVDLRTAMALAAHRDSIARQYRDGYGELFELGLPTLGTRFSLMAAPVTGAPDAGTVAAVQRLYLALLSSVPDSHIVRIHGEAVAHIVMTAAQGWRVRQRCHGGLDGDPDFAAWDASLKADHINPGTTADLTVAALLIAGLRSPSPSAAGPPGPGGTDRDT